MRYRLGSGPFGPSNTSVSFEDRGRPRAVVPQWENECPFDQGGGRSYDTAAHTVTVPIGQLGLTASAVVTEVGGTPISSAEPAAVALSVDPSAPISLAAGP